MPKFGEEYWDDMRFLLAVGRTGSFSRASRVLRAHQTTVGRRIQELEEKLGVRLVHRHSRGVSLSEMGKMVFARAQDMAESAELIERETASADLQMIGPVTITTTEGLGGGWLLPKLRNFQRRHQGIQIILDTTSIDRSLAAREADIAIRFNRPPDQKNYIVRRVGRVRFFAAASRSYLREWGTPENEHDLAAHRFVVNTPMPKGPTWEIWRSIITHSKGIAFQSNSAAAVGEAIINSFGIGILPTYAQDYSPEVVQLPIEVGEPVDCWLVTHTETLQAKRVRTVVDFIYKCFADDRYRLFFD